MVTATAGAAVAVVALTTGSANYGVSSTVALPRGSCACGGYADYQYDKPDYLRRTKFPVMVHYRSAKAAAAVLQIAIGNDLPISVTLGGVT